MYTKKRPMLFIYNKEFDIKNNLGLRYNENWANIQKKYKKEEIIYPGIIDEDLIITNWKLSKSIKPLAVKTDKFKGKPMGEAKPLLIDRNKVKIIIFPGGNVKDFAKKKTGSFFYVFDKTIKKIEYDDDNDDDDEVKIFETDK